MRSKEEICETIILHFALAATRASAAPFALAPNAATNAAFFHPTKAGAAAPATFSFMTESTFDSLLELRRRFLIFLERRVDDRAIAEDILQAAYLRALAAKGRLREDESAVAWFYRILRNAVIDHYRRRTTEGSALERWARELDSAPAPEPHLQETTCQCIAGALEVIAPAYADLVREVDLGEGSLAHYASVQGITPGNAAVRAHRARATLRKQLIRCCGTCAEHGCVECTCRASAAVHQQGSALSQKHPGDRR
jgi:RNA polymerase sigma factor (sigma-70 family)